IILLDEHVNLSRAVLVGDLMTLRSVVLGAPSPSCWRGRWARNRYRLSAPTSSRPGSVRSCRPSATPVIPPDSQRPKAISSRLWPAPSRASASSARTSLRRDGSGGRFSRRTNYPSLSHHITSGLSRNWITLSSGTSSKTFSCSHLPNVYPKDRLT